jgi:hypothetical protein
MLKGSNRGSSELRSQLRTAACLPRIKEREGFSIPAQQKLLREFARFDLFVKGTKRELAGCLGRLSQLPHQRGTERPDVTLQHRA